MVDAILPSSGRIYGSLSELTGVEIKALLNVGGSTLLEKAIGACADSGVVHRTVVVAPSEIRDSSATTRAEVVLPEGASAIDNIIKGVSYLARAGISDRVLIVTTDLPFLTGAMIRQFVEACPADVDICLPIVHREEFDKAFPEAARDFVRLHDGQFTMGCIFLLNPSVIYKNRGNLECIFAARKNQMAMVRLLGPLFIWRFLTRQLTVERIESRCSQILGCQGRAIFDCAPDLAFDIDMEEDYHYATEWLARMGGN